MTSILGVSGSTSVDVTGRVVIHCATVSSTSVSTAAVRCLFEGLEAVVLWCPVDLAASFPADPPCWYGSSAVAGRSVSTASHKSGDVPG